ncbi:MAG: hypothetical protein Q7U54_05345 [Bacteroidales bacterium]|nr:hypothetical protein [Bacteroidales bacterium]
MNANKTKKRTLLILLALGIAISTYAQDRLFTYTYQSSVLNKGQRELESWNTLRAGREDYYARFDNRAEYEIGLGKNLQTAFYLNLTSTTSTSIDNSNKSLSTENEIGFSNEWKLKLLDPVANPLGAAIYGEVGIFSNEIELEGKVILDKKIGNFTIAANGVFEQEFAPGYVNDELKWHKEKKIEGYLAFAYSFSPKFSLTLENAYKNVFIDSKLTNSAMFSGLGFSYVQDKFWVNFTAMPQITSFKGASNNNLNLNEYEKIQLRLLFSFML